MSRVKFEKISIGIKAFIKVDFKQIEIEKISIVITVALASVRD